MKRVLKTLVACSTLLITAQVWAQNNASDTRLSVGGYGEVAMSRNFYSDNVIEAIMWHGYSKESDAYWCTEKFYNLSKEERDAVVEFINSI